MNDLSIVIKEQLTNWRIIFRLSSYQEKANYQSHYLGMLWQVLNPLIQVGTYFIIFGLALKGNRQPIDGAPYLVWLLFGMSVWFWINSSVTQASQSVFSQIGLVSKLKFPVSIMPTTAVVSNLTTFFPMIILSLVIMFSNGIGVSIYWLQFFYYFFATFMFLIAFGILNSTVSMLVRDYHLLLQAVFRILFYFSGTIVDIRGLKDIGGGGDALLKILELNPMYYLTSGMRDSFIGGTWFYEKPTLSIMFWLVVFLILLFGSHLHLKFRSRFVDFL